jgi:hypothetical protein
VNNPLIVPDSAIPVSPLGIALDMAEYGVSVNVTLSDVAGTALWTAQGEAGVTRLHATPPDEIMARAVELHVYLERVPIEGEPQEEPYLGLLRCGCLVGYNYRPAITAHCPTHAVQRVCRVDYPRLETQ